MLNFICHPVCAFHLEFLCVCGVGVLLTKKSCISCLLKQRNQNFSRCHRSSAISCWTAAAKDWLGQGAATSSGGKDSVHRCRCSSITSAPQTPPTADQVRSQFPGPRFIHVSDHAFRSRLPIEFRGTIERRAIPHRFRTVSPGRISAQRARADHEPGNPKERSPTDTTTRT